MRSTQNLSTNPQIVDNTFIVMDADTNVLLASYDLMTGARQYAVKNSKNYHSLVIKEFVLDKEMCLGRWITKCSYYNSNRVSAVDRAINNMTLARGA